MPDLSSNQLTSTSVLQVDVTSDQTMLIISGIAIPEFAAAPSNNSNPYSADYIIDLGVYALDVVKSSVTVGLVDVATNSGAFQFGAGETKISLGGDGKVSLTVTLQIVGQSTLHRFSYQVVLLVKTVITKVTGSVKWSKALWDLAQASSGIPSSLEGQLGIAAVKSIPPPPGQLGGATQTVKTGKFTSFTHAADSDTCEAEYEIDGVDFGETLSVQVSPGSEFKTTSNLFIEAEQTSGPALFSLTPENPTQTCDFEITTTPQPK